ncbi:DinB family protein [Bacillus niameyensis]|uniref:DinB family protein n=1 Tax=Bacillus niameyensis TaxID=1522308 RepID=UPI000A03BAFA|nr:DinB family protein [Bacillus niameyensis]
MQNKEQLLDEFSGLIPYVQSMRELDEKMWATPIAEGKWTPKDMIAHIMLWDKYFLEEAIQRITSQQPLTAKHLDFDEFNKKAVEYAKNKTVQEIIGETVHYRNELLRQLESISDEDFTKEHIDGEGNPFSAYYYLIGFIPHDAHHIEQLKVFFS